MKKILILIAAMAGMTIGAYAQDNVVGTVNLGNTNVTDATVIIPGETKGNWTRLTEVATSSDGATVGKLLVAEGWYKFIQNVTNAGGTKISITGGPGAGGQNLTNCFAVLPTFTGLGFETIVVTNANTTNIFLQTAPTSNQVSGNPIYITKQPVEMWSVPNLTLTNSVLYSPVANIYLPGGDVMSVLRVTNSGSLNTKIGVSGYKFNR